MLKIDEYELVTGLFPVAWQHISLVGQYEITSKTKLPNLETVTEQLISNLKQLVIITKRPRD